MKYFFPIIDNGMGLSRTGWGACFAIAQHSPALQGHELAFSSISLPYPDGAMNVATRQFLESDADFMVTIDTDLLFQQIDFTRLLQHGQDDGAPFIAGIYPIKKAGLEFPIVPLPDKPHPLANCDDPDVPNVVEVAGCTRGFSCIHRSVFELLAPHVESYECPFTGGESKWFWKNKPGSHSEDFGFCELYREHGGRVLIDTRIRLKHEGSAVYPIPGTY